MCPDPSPIAVESKGNTVFFTTDFTISGVLVHKQRDVFERYDADHDNNLGLNELAQMFREISNRLTSLPATAQVASQQGKYLAKKFNKLEGKKVSQTSERHIDDVEQEEILTDPFVYRHLGSLACQLVFSDDMLIFV